MTTHTLMKTSLRTPVYFSLITLCCAIASATDVWVGIASFAFVALIVAIVEYWIARH